MSVGPGEVLLLLAVLLLLFGAKKLPELARSMGQASKEFRKGIRDGSEEKASVEGPCPFCGTEVPAGSEFCPGCAKSSSDIRAERAKKDQAST